LTTKDAEDAKGGKKNLPLMNTDALIGRFFPILLRVSVVKIGFVIVPFEVLACED
jgi:hypothetical protein